jgi:DNA-binding transcriptional regulator YiaG
MAEEELIERIAGAVTARLSNAPKSEPTRENRYLREREAAKFLGVSTHTLRAWRSRSPLSGLPVTRIGKVILHSMKELERYMEERTVGGGR